MSKQFISKNKYNQLVSDFISGTGEFSKLDEETGKNIFKKYASEKYLEKDMNKSKAEKTTKIICNVKMVLNDKDNIPVNNKAIEVYVTDKLKNIQLLDVSKNFKF